MATCVVCREEIKQDAKKCIHCDSYQDFRRWINISSVVLSLMIALLSVTAVTLPVLKDFMLPPDAELNFSLVEKYDDYTWFRIAVSNSGTKAAVIKAVQLTYGKRPEIESTFDMLDAEQVIDPGKTTTFRISNPNFSPKENEKMEDCTILIKYVGFNMKIREKSLRCSP